MKKKAAYYLFSLLIVLSSTFGIAPMAFCTMKPPAPQHSCCKPPVTTPTKCPICAFDLNKVEPSPANTAVILSIVSQHVISFISHTAATIPLVNFANTKIGIVTYIDSSPPLYLQYCSFRIWSDPSKPRLCKYSSLLCRILWYTLLYIPELPFAALL